MVRGHEASELLKIEADRCSRSTAWIFLSTNSEDPKKVEARLDTFRRIAKKNGLSNPLLSGGVMRAECLWPTGWPVDFVTTYMDMPNLAQRAELYPYEFSSSMRRTGGFVTLSIPASPMCVCSVRWIPTLARSAAIVAFPNRDEWTGALKRVKGALDRYPNLGIPVAGGRKKMLLIYAWNELARAASWLPPRATKK